MHLIFLGLLGAGKGTQAAKLASYLKTPHISTGEMFRQMADSGSILGVSARDEYWGNGKNCPDEITNKILEERLTLPDCKDGFILDGYPRNLGQACFLEELLERKALFLDAVLHIKIAEQTILERLSSRRRCPKCPTTYGLGNLPKQEGICDNDGAQLVQRIDDTPEKIQQRLEVYRKETLPLVGHYSHLRKDVDGEQSPGKVFEEILRILGFQESFK
ncbi:nucleoside monophosphate kinase [Candidatus Woesearchaeota archaeon]|nr:nucleoside monophosphate kinase [Candidatus Woesearchaeota archaeon]